MDETRGFFKVENGELIIARTNIGGPGFDLFFEMPHLQTYPIEGWYWFDTELQAREFFNIPYPAYPEYVPSDK